jgi:hypothetical protein
MPPKRKAAAGREAPAAQRQKKAPAAPATDGPDEETTWQVDVQARKAMCPGYEADCNHSASRTKFSTLTVPKSVRVHLGLTDKQQLIAQPPVEIRWRFGLAEWVRPLKYGARSSVSYCTRFRPVFAALQLAPGDTLHMGGSQNSEMPGLSPVEQIEKAAALLQQGLLTAAEFGAMKRQAIAAAPPNEAAAGRRRLEVALKVTLGVDVKVMKR